LLNDENREVKTTIKPILNFKVYYLLLIYSLIIEILPYFENFIVELYFKSSN